MDNFTFFELLQNNKNYSVEHYIDKLCVDLENACVKLKQDRGHQVVTLSNKLIEILTYCNNSGIINAFYESTSRHFKAAYNKLLTFCLDSEKCNISSISQLLCKCTTFANALPPDILQHCKNVLLQTFKQCFDNLGDIKGSLFEQSEIDCHQTNLFVILDSCLIDADNIVAIEIFSLLTTAMLNLNLNTSIMKSFSKSFSKSLTRLVLSETDHSLVICQAMQKALHFVNYVADLLKDKLSTLNGLAGQKKDIAFENISKSITLLDTIFDFAATNMEKCTVYQQSLSDFVSSYATWLMIQMAMYHKFANTRKKAAVCLRHILIYISEVEVGVDIFWSDGLLPHDNLRIKNYEECCLLLHLNSSKISRTISALTSFVEICEMLEESQVHVVKPVSNKIISLFKQPCQELPVSWLFSILRRMFSHESRVVQNEGLVICLSTKIENFLVKEKYYLNFIFDGLLNILREDFLYFQSSCDSSSNENSLLSHEVNIVSMLKEFLCNCQEKSSNAKMFMKTLLHGISFGTWSPVSLLYVCDSLYSLPPIRAWESNDIAAVRKILCIIVKTHDGYLKNTIQRLVIGSFMKHCNPACLSVEDFLQLVFLCAKDNAIIYATKFWKEIAEWFFVENQQMKKPQRVAVGVNCYQLVAQWADVVIPDILPNSPYQNSHNYVPTQLSALCFCLILDETFNEDHSNAKELVDVVISVISKVTDKAATHVYMPQNRINSAFFFISTLMDILMSNETDRLCSILLIPCIKIFEGILEYVSRKIPSSCPNFDQAKLYLNCTENLLMFLLLKASAPQRSRLLNRLKAALSCIIQSISHLHIKLRNIKKATEESVQLCLVSSLSMRWCCQLIIQYDLVLDSASLAKISEYLSCLDLNSEKLGKPDDFLHEDWGKIMIEYLELQWTCVPYSLRKRWRTSAENAEDTLKLLTMKIDVMSGTGLAKLFTVAQVLLAEVKSDDSQVSAYCIEAMWRSCCESFHASSFRSLYNNFVSAVFQPRVLSASTDTVVCQSVNKVLSEIVVHSQLKQGLLRGVIEACKQWWLANIDQWGNGAKSAPTYPHSNGNSHGDAVAIILQTIIQNINCLKVTNTTITSPSIRSAHQYMDFFIDCLIYSPSLSKDTRSIYQASIYASSIHSNIAATLPASIGSQVSLTATSVLTNLSLSNPDHVTFAAHLLHQLFDRDDLLTAEKPRYHHASSMHYTKHRIWQNILLLLPVLPSSQSSDVAESLVHRLTDDMQASVRHLMEWSVVLLLYKFPNLEQILETKLKNNVGRGASFSSICSYLSVLLLCGVCRKHQQFNSSVEQQQDYFLRLVDLVFPWCMTQHFSIRLYGHAVLLRIENFFKGTGNEGFLYSKYPFLRSCLNFADNSSGNVVKNWTRIKDHFMLFKLDPVADYSLETIFSTLPYLCHMDSPDASTINELLNDSWLPLRNPRDLLRQLKPSLWLATPSKNQSGDATQLSVDDQVAVANLQKKIVVDQHKKMSRPGLILVASLVQKPSNLGGLTRTCEVFGAERMTVHNLSCVDDKLFQALSVTAHKWMALEEVKRWQVEEYLIRMRAQGYTLIGSEQTERSQSLPVYKFPEKCVMVLGNEKEGIPDSILTLLDSCIEIPQVGVIRSLNVHVSGAVMIWEYFKQHKTGQSIGKDSA